MRICEWCGYGPTRCYHNDSLSRWRLEDRLALWTRHSAAAGRELGKRLRILKWADAADTGRLSR